MSFKNAYPQIISEQSSVFDRIANDQNDTTKTRSPYYIIETRNDIPSNFRIIRKLSHEVAIIQALDSVAFKFTNNNLKIAPANDEWKFTSTLLDRLQQKTIRSNHFVLSGSNLDSLLADLKSISAQLKVLQTNTQANALLVNCSISELKIIASLKSILFIDEVYQAKPETGIIGYDRSINHINTVDYEIPGADGHGIIVGIKENSPDSNDLDLYKRVLVSPLASDEISSHATVVASIIGGAGNSFYDGRGIAYGSRFFPSGFDNLFADSSALLLAMNVTVQNHSYGTVIQQFYGPEAFSYDKQTWENKNLVHVFSAGNQGSEAASEGIYKNLVGFANITGNFKMAKNVITVGAIDNKENILSVSSSGPTYDGRLAPQITALGSSGTSDAAAMVSGTVAVMQQVFKDSNNQQLPPASLIKAVLYNTARDIYLKGIDYKTGYGLLDSYAAVRAIQQKQYLSGKISSGDEWTRSITVPANAASLKMTLCWTDSAASLNNFSALINDLDFGLEQEETGTIYRPWILNSSPSIAALQEAPVRGRDSLNTSEQISIDLPAAGIYTIRVKGYHIETENLPFNIALEIDTVNRFEFMNPVHSADINKSEQSQLAIRWKTSLKDTVETGNLFVSYDHGSSWSVISTNQKLSGEKFLWTINDTTSFVRFRMETAFGNFYSNDLMLAPVIRPVVDFYCVDSFGLSWKKQSYAEAYKIYALTNSPYLEMIRTTNDTFSVFNRSVYPYKVFAVEPVLSNNVPAARSLALNLDFQGVDCFYKTFYYNLLDQNNLNLVLELSTVKNVDSVYFENTTVDGRLIQIVGAAKVNGGNFQYIQSAKDLPTGNSYFRVRIVLKNGQVIFTNILSILTTGKQQILFYPNPVHRSGSLHYILQQGLFGDNQLQLFDATGRLIKSYDILPEQIDVSQFPAGILIFKLFNSQRKVLQTGKILIE